MPARGAVTLFHVRGIRIGIDYSWFFVLFLVIFMLSGSYRDVLDTPSGDALPYALAVISALALFGSCLGLTVFSLLPSARGAVIQSVFESRIEGIRVADVMDSEPVAIPEDASVERALDEYFLRYRWPWFPVVDAAQRFLGLIERGAADAVPEPARTSSTVREVFTADAGGGLMVGVDAPLESLLGNDNLR